MVCVRIDNPTARALWLTSHGLTAAPSGACDPLAIIRQLGFVQLDSIQVVSRAHHHILWSRNQNYREPMLDALLRDRRVFEHFTHDASVLPMETLPMWRRQFRRKQARVARSSWFAPHLDPSLIAAVVARITEEGPLSTQAFDTRAAGDRAMWDRPPHKMVLDYLWYAGVLATCHRDGFTKVYDLAQRVFPADLPELEDEAQVTALCRAALDRLGFGTAGEIRKFWDACDGPEVAGWAERDADRLRPVAVQAADGGWYKALACPDIADRIAALTGPGRRMRILNPFDPAIRDRARLSRLFGFDYTVEMFVPAAKRRWGYYVYPLLEGHHFVGRIEAKGDRARGVLSVSRLWTETGQPLSGARRDRLEAELTRFARLAGLDRVVWSAS